MNGFRQRIKAEFVNSFGNKCCVCKKTFPMGVYDFHHMEPSNKKYAISQLYKWGARKILLEEIQKCVMVCSNCHRLVHLNIMNIPKNAIKFKEKNVRHCRNFLNEIRGVFNNEQRRT